MSARACVHARGRRGRASIAPRNAVALRGASRLLASEPQRALVDAVVVAKPENHHQSNDTAYEPAFTGELRRPMDSIAVMMEGIEPPKQQEEQQIDEPIGGA